MPEPHTNSEHPGLLTEKQAAEYLAISARKLWELRNRREVRCVRIGRSVRYDPADLRDYINRSKRGTLWDRAEP